ncbi:unnamed protein product [Meloidogyne enterolobii]|uniref:Uncharacterized protein n=3 Tax=Meloidogyne enterolobii TaxID=390850 RepID=A0ACB0XY97_MELEN
MRRNDKNQRKEHHHSAPPEEGTEMSYVDKGISNFGQLHLNYENSRLTNLTLSHNKITLLPSNISDLTSLESLNLWNNHIEELPATISALPNLKLLNVGMNRLNKLPRGFGSFQKLEILDLTYNNLNEHSLPGNFFFMPTLRALYLGDNDFEGFPEDVGHLGNRLQVIPPELGALDLIDPNDENAKTLRVENNPWILPLKEVLMRGAQNGDWFSGVEAFWNYIRSDNYRRLYESHPVGIGSPPPKRSKEKKISRSGKGGDVHSRGQSKER